MSSSRRDLFILVVVIVVYSLIIHMLGRHAGYRRGRDEVLREAVECGAACLMSDSRTGEVKVLWVTKAEDRRQVQSLFRTEKGASDER